MKPRNFLRCYAVATDKTLPDGSVCRSWIVGPDRSTKWQAKKLLSRVRHGDPAAHLIGRLILKRSYQR